MKEISAFSGYLLRESLRRSLVVERSQDKGKVGLIALYKEKNLPLPLLLKLLMQPCRCGVVTEKEPLRYKALR